jgi:hypothetical protein
MVAQEYMHSQNRINMRDNKKHVYKVNRCGLYFPQLETSERDTVKHYL